MHRSFLTNHLHFSMLSDILFCLNGGGYIDYISSSSVPCILSPLAVICKPSFFLSNIVFINEENNVDCQKSKDHLHMSLMHFYWRPAVVQWVEVPVTWPPIKMRHRICATGADLEGTHPARTPSIFCRDKAPDFVWVPQAKRMHQIVRIDFENCNFSSLLRGHIPLRHNPVPTGAKVL